MPDVPPKFPSIWNGGCASNRFGYVFPLIASLSKRDGLDDSAAAAVEKAIAQIPGVKAVRRYADLNGALVDPSG